MLGLSTAVHRGEARRSTQTTGQLGLGYRDSSLSTDLREGLPENAPRAGDRAPDAPLPDGTRLFDAFRGPHWTLLAAGPEIQAPALPVRTVGIPAHESYGTGLFLIRPDGYVGWTGDTASGLRAYARRLGVLGQGLSQDLAEEPS
jgi:hypothetical protein